MFYYVHRGNPRKRGSSTRLEQDSGDEDDDNEEKLGQRFHWTTRDEIQKFGTKEIWATSNARRC
jgi:hypothetical protein